MEASFVAVFETGRVYEWDAARALVARSGIPGYGQQRSISGLVEAMSSTPAPGPGVSFALLVPVERAHEAVELLRGAGFAVGSEPGVWHFSSDERARARWRALALVVLLAFAVVAAVELVPRFGR